MKKTSSGTGYDLEHLSDDQVARLERLLAGALRALGCLRRELEREQGAREFEGTWRPSPHPGRLLTPIAHSGDIEVLADRLAELGDGGDDDDDPPPTPASAPIRGLENLEDAA